MFLPKKNKHAMLNETILQKKMNKELKICLLVIPLIILTIIISIFLIQKFKVFNARENAKETIEVGDNKKIKDLEPLEQIEINYDDSIGTLTIPDLLLYRIPVKESVELETLEEAVGHFTNTSIYSGNVGLASHNSGTKGDYFKNLNKIKKGCEVYYETIFGTRRYVVKTIEVIDETDWTFLQETEDNRITLITCVAGKKDKRLCVQAIESEENMINNQ